MDYLPNTCFDIGFRLTVIEYPPSSKVIHETGFYYGMGWLLPKKCCINQVRGYFYFTFLMLLFVNGAMLVISMKIYCCFLEHYKETNQSFLFFCLFFGWYFGWVVCGQFLLLCPYISASHRYVTSWGKDIFEYCNLFMEYSIYLLIGVSIDDCW